MGINFNSGDIAENVIMAVMTGAVDTHTADRLLMIHAGVTRAMFCPVTGRILDSRTAMLWEIEEDGEPVGFGVFDPTVERNQLEAVVPPGLTLGTAFDPAPVYAQLSA